MIKNFANKFGKPEDTLFIMGDFDKGDYNMK
jgi:calcineurin-like phosphoesterase family protein